jgi:hypothetical protein
LSVWANGNGWGMRSTTGTCPTACCPDGGFHDDDDAHDDDDDDDDDDNGKDATGKTKALVLAFADSLSNEKHDDDTNTTTAGETSRSNTAGSGRRAFSIVTECLSCL